MTFERLVKVATLVQIVNIVKDLYYCCQDDDELVAVERLYQRYIVEGKCYGQD